MIAQGTVRSLLIGVCCWLSHVTAKGERGFDFQRDTFAFDNETALEYHNGHASPRPPGEPPKRFTQHCFVMSRTVEQFRKFVRFEPALAPLGDRELVDRIRTIARISAWRPPLPAKERIVMPGYADLRSLSTTRPEIVQKNIGLGWPTYFRPGNWRIVLPHGASQQAQTHWEMDRALASRNGFFVAYLTNFPRSLNINHAVLVYARKKQDRQGTSQYAVYDPNHHDAPRILEWSEEGHCFRYQRDTDFVGGKVIVWQVYGRPIQ